MIAVYIVSVALAGGLVGVFSYQVLAAEGYITGFESGVMVAGGMACVYIALQLAYMTLVTLFLPTRDRAPFFVESLSQLTALALLPYLLRLEITIPVDWLAPYMPLVYLGAFAGLHGLLKFVSFFAFTSGRPAWRWPSLFWFGGAAVCAYGALVSIQAWASATEGARPQASRETSTYRVGDVFARAASIPEGSIFEYHLPQRPGMGLTLRWAVPPQAANQLEDGIANVVMYFHGASSGRVATRIAVRPGQWTEQRLAADAIPEGADRLTLFWSQRSEPPWQRLLGFHPVVTTTSTLLLAGPYSHETRVDDEGPNIVLIAVDGLGWANMSLAGHGRGTTPALDRLATTLQFFPFTYAPAPESTASSMSLLTGLSPLRHGYRDGKFGALPGSLPTLAERFREAGYTTAAFTEGESPRDDDLVYGSGFERGFEWFDPSYRLEAPQDVDDTASDDVDPDVGSRWTLNKSRSWIDRRQDTKFFVFMRLRESSEFRYRPAYGSNLLPDRDAPTPRHVYESSLQYLDRQLAAFIKFIRDYETRRNTVIIVTGTHGYEFDRAGQPSVGLTEDSLRVPLIMYIPAHRRVERRDLIGLEDVPLAALALAGLEAGPLLDGRDFLAGPNGNEPIAVLGDPPAVSIRTARWRFSWAPYVDAAASPGGLVELYDLTRYRPGRDTLRNVASRNPAVVRRQQEVLNAYLGGFEKSPSAPE